MPRVHFQVRFPSLWDARGTTTSPGHVVGIYFPDPCPAEDHLLRSNHWKDPGGPGEAPKKQKAAGEMFTQSHSKKERRTRRRKPAPLRAPCSSPLGSLPPACLDRGSVDPTGIPLRSSCHHPCPAGEGQGSPKAPHLQHGTPARGQDHADSTQQSTALILNRA